MQSACSASPYSGSGARKPHSKLPRQLLLPPLNTRRQKLQTMPGPPKVSPEGYSRDSISPVSLLFSHCPRHLLKKHLLNVQVLPPELGAGGAGKGTGKPVQGPQPWPV